MESKLEPLGETTRNTMERVRLEWIGNYKVALRKQMDGLSTRKPMSDFDKGYNSCLEDCIALLMDE